MISIFDYTEAQSFLKDYLQALPKKGWGVSRKLAAHLGVNTSLISLILTDRQSLSLEQAYGVSGFFGWNRLEKKYFLLMVQLQRAGTADLKKFYTEEMNAVKKDALKLSERLGDYQGLTDEQRTKLYSSATYSTIRLFCSLGENGKSLGEIQEELGLTLAELRPMVDFLVESRLLEIEKSRYFLGHQHTHLEKGSPHLVKHHTNWRLKSIQKAERLSDDELIFTGPMSMSKADFMKVREEVVQLIQRTVETMKASPAEVVVCMNIDWFKVSSGS
jgi:uncharacterized protein (TIGR02147 family)